MAFEQFCLKWNNFQSNILTAFESLQSTEDLADVTLACEGTTIKAHKFILSACSPYFRTIFKENPCSHPVVILKDVHYSDLIALLNFMYHGEVMVSKEQLQTFLKTAEVLQVSGLKSLPDLCQKMKTKRIIQEIEPECAKKQRIERKQDKIEDRQPNEQENKTTTPILPVDSIKIEAEDAPSDTESFPEKQDSPGKDKSLLEAALEVKDAPASILERSLTSQANSVKTNLAEIKCESIPRKPPEESNKREIDDSDHMTNSNDSIGNGGVSATPAPSITEPPVHHSSQCGTCPHCKLPFTNQSSLKYHVRLVHSELLNLYCCHLCPLTFGFRYGYKKHMADVHSVRT